MSVVALAHCSCCHYARCGDGTLRCCPALIGYENERDCIIYSPWVDLTIGTDHLFKFRNLPDLKYVYWSLEIDGDDIKAGEISVEFKVGPKRLAGTGNAPMRYFRSDGDQGFGASPLYDLPGTRLIGPDVDAIVDVIKRAESGRVRLVGYGYLGVPRSFSAS